MKEDGKPTKREIERGLLENVLQPATFCCSATWRFQCIQRFFVSTTQHRCTLSSGGCFASNSHQKIDILSFPSPGMIPFLFFSNLHSLFHFYNAFSYLAKQEPSSFISGRSSSSDHCSQLHDTIQILCVLKYSTLDRNTPFIDSFLIVFLCNLSSAADSSWLTNC